jgi:hypothetical protein
MSGATRNRVFSVLFFALLALAPLGLAAQEEEGEAAIQEPEEGEAAPEAPDVPPIIETPSESSDEASAEETALTGSRQRWFDRTVFSFGGSLLIFMEDYGLEAAPTPILSAPFFAFALPPLDRTYVGVCFEVTLDMYFTNYRYSYRLNRPIPAEIENRSAFVFGLMPAFQLQGRVNLGKTKARLSGGAAIDFRLVGLALDLNEADVQGPPEWNAATQTDDIRAYYDKPERMIYPFAGFGVDFQFTPRWAAGLDIRVWIPLDGGASADNPFLGYRVGIGVRISRKNGVL